MWGIFDGVITLDFLLIINNGAETYFRALLNIKQWSHKSTCLCHDWTIQIFWLNICTQIELKALRLFPHVQINGHRILSHQRKHWTQEKDLQSPRKHEVLGTSRSNHYEAMYLISYEAM